MFRGNLTYEFTPAERQLLFQALDNFQELVAEVYAEIEPDAQKWAILKAKELRNKFEDN